MKYTANPIKVDAYEIVSIANPVSGVKNGYQITIDNGGLYETVVATPEMCSRMTPKIGDYWVVQPDGYVYLNPKDVFENKYSAELKPRLPVGVSVLITDEHGRILVGERLNVSAAGWISTPGGRLEEDETMYRCAVRETKAETNLDIDAESLTVLGFADHFRFGQHYIMIYLHASRYNGELKVMEPDKCKEWVWAYPSLLLATDNFTEPREIIDLLPGRHPIFENLSSPDKPVIEGLEKYETQVALEQPQYFPLRTLQQRDNPGGVLTRWTFTDEQRRAVGRGADLLLEQLTFREGLPPVRLILADRPNPSAFKQLYQLERPLKPCPHCNADLSNMGREEQKKHLGGGAICHATPKGQVQ